MDKKIYKDVTLNCIMQQNELSETECRNGVISMCEDGFRFEETVKKHHDSRNPFIYEGKHCTLTHRKDGKYQINMRPIDATKISDRNDLAFSVYSDIISALKVID